MLASGERLSLGGSLVKNNTGYDLRQLFIGSEGTLGLIVEATLSLTRPPSGHLVVLCAVVSDAAVLELFTRLRRSSLTVSAFECFDRGCIERVIAHRGVDQAAPLEELGAMQILVEIELASPELPDLQGANADALMELLADAQEAGELVDAVVAQTEAQARELWAWREDISESLHPHTPHKADVAVPIKEVARFVTSWRAAVAEFLRRCHDFDPIMYGLVREFGGSVSAEHGIGLLKRAYLDHTRSPAEIAAMRQIKAIFDPQGILNPGKLFSP